MLTSESRSKIKKLLRVQDEFIFSESRYPCFCAAWATGKSLCGIGKGLKLSKESPGNLGIIFRAEYTDLEDSTIRDYERYTGRRINHQRKEDILPNGSVILFRHAKDVDEAVKQNLNLGWFWIEQGEELDSDRTFTLLRGRLRRDDVKQRTGFVTANTNGRNWIWKKWKKSLVVVEKGDHYSVSRSSDTKYTLCEADSFVNVKNIPADTMSDWKDMAKDSREIFNRFVMNSWEEEDASSLLIPFTHLEPCIDNRPLNHNNKLRYVSIDPGDGGDPTSILGMIHTKVKYRISVKQKDSRVTCEYAMRILNKLGARQVVVDAIGIGVAVRDGMKTKVGNDNVVAICSAEKSSDPKQYALVRDEMGWVTREAFQDQEIWMINHPSIIEDLTTPKFVSDSNKIIKIEPKKEIRKRLGRSPNDGDAFMQAQYAVKRGLIKPVDARPARTVMTSSKLPQRTKRRQYAEQPV